MLNLVTILVHTAYNGLIFLLDLSVILIIIFWISHYGYCFDYARDDCVPCNEITVEAECSHERVVNYFWNSSTNKCE